jgi:hypothetical protein
MVPLLCERRANAEVARKTLAHLHFWIPPAGAMPRATRQEWARAAVFAGLFTVG